MLNAQEDLPLGEPSWSSAFPGEVVRCFSTHQPAPRRAVRPEGRTDDG